MFHNGKSPYNIDMKGAKVLDIGGGPTSLLLKCVNKNGVVVDPLPLPAWVEERYRIAGITFCQMKGENIDLVNFDECWIYNVLQHTENPQKVVENARRAAKLIRLFEWIDTPTNEGHPHSLNKGKLTMASFL
jgi:2-polyprenyl-3-methyl-5-hydroxy-6-metoxy-1,4-benzoquinol methylase